MRRWLVLVCGLLSAAMGGVLLLVSGRVGGLAWLAFPITALGLVLIGLWLRSALRPAGPDGAPAGPLPGRWYSYALVGTLVLLACWLLYWAKLR